MTRKVFYISILFAVLVGFMIAIVAGASYFFLIYKPAASGQTNPNGYRGTGSSDGVKIDLSSVDSIELRTTYLGFYDEGSNCRNMKNPYSGTGSADSRCSTYLTFNRDGSATKRLEIPQNYNGGNQPGIDKTEWKGKISPDEFDALIRQISGGNDFIEWTPMDSDRSNFTITVNYQGSSIRSLYQGKSIQQFNNITESGGTGIRYVNVFSELDRKISWQKI